MGKTYFNADDAQSAKQAEFFCTIGNRRYSMLNGKNFEAKASVTLADVKSLGRLITQKKATGLEVKLTFTAYKCSEMFDNLVEEFKNTGVLPRFECQVTSEDEASNIGRSTKIFLTSETTAIKQSIHCRQHDMPFRNMAVVPNAVTGNKKSFNLIICK